MLCLVSSKPDKHNFKKTIPFSLRMAKKWLTTSFQNNKTHNSLTSVYDIIYTKTYYIDHEFGIKYIFFLSFNQKFQKKRRNEIKNKIKIKKQFLLACCVFFFIEATFCLNMVCSSVHSLVHQIKHSTFSCVYLIK